MAKDNYLDANLKSEYDALVKKPTTPLPTVTIANSEKRTRAELLDILEELFDSEQDAGSDNVIEKNIPVDAKKFRAFIHMLIKGTANTSDDTLGGLTTAQEQAIAANTAKTGISTSQANAITANTAKTGISTSQANAIVANTAKVTQNLTTAKSTLEFQVLNQKGSYSIAFVVVCDDGRRRTAVLPLR